MGIARQRTLVYPDIMDALDKLIADKETEVSGLRERIVVLEAELSALRLAAELRPVATSKRPAKSSRTGGGRRPGDISQTWRDILSSMFCADKAPYSYDDIGGFARSLGNELAASSIRDRVRSLKESGFLEGDARSGFTVTEDAVKRFDFTKENEEAAAPSEANTGSAGGTSGVLDLQPKPTEAQEKGVSHVASRFEN